MSRPATPSRALPMYGDGPPSYMNTPTDEDGSNGHANNSSLRLLPQVGDGDFRPYVSSSTSAVVGDRKPIKRRPVATKQAGTVHWDESSLLVAQKDFLESETLESLFKQVEQKIMRNNDALTGRSPTLKAKVTLRRSTQTDRSPSYRALRTSPDRYQRPAASTVIGSRPGSSLGYTPTMPLPTANPRNLPSERGSPIRPGTPSRTSSDRRPPPSTVSYEPADLNGSPRPGTPSSQYGGSPRRPLPPAPLFASAGNRTHSDDATISIPDDASDDVFGNEGEIMPDNDPRASRRSFNSYNSESTATDEYDLEDSEKVEHYGPAPEGKQDRRGAREAQISKKEVRLINGELILECKIPTILHSFLPRRDEREFTHMRYTAVTCDPDDFVLNGYRLRQNIGTTTRETELFICVTMYNESEVEFTRTMHGIMRNIAHFCSRLRSRTWARMDGKKSWFASSPTDVRKYTQER